MQFKHNLTSTKIKMTFAPVYNLNLIHLINCIKELCTLTTIHNIYTIMCLALSFVLDFVDLSCLEVNVKFAVGNVAAMFLVMWRLC